MTREPQNSFRDSAVKRERAIRTVERWGLVAGVTGVAGNILIIVLWTIALPGIADYDWTGPANDFVGGVVFPLTFIPVMHALKELVGGGRGVQRMTTTAVWAMAIGPVLSVLLITGALSFEIQSPFAMLGALIMFSWFGVIGRAGGKNGSLPRGLARSAVLTAKSVFVGVALLLVSLAFPWGSPPQIVIAVLAVLPGVAALLYVPVWLIRLSYAPRAHWTRLPTESGVHAYL